MNKLLNIEICTNNRDDRLFRYLLSTIHVLTPLSALLDVTVNFNGDISDGDIERCRSLLSELGFTVHAARHSYSFPEGEHSMLRIREDAYCISSDTYGYVLLLDDDTELLGSYARVLSAALTFLEAHPGAGIVGIQDYRPYRRGEEKLFPADPRHNFSLQGGLLLRVIPEWGGLVPEHLRSRFGGGEDMLCAVERMRYGLTAHYINLPCYIHEQRRTASSVTGNQAYSWSYDTDGSRNNILSYLHGLGVTGRLPVTVWQGAPYWNDEAAVFSFDCLPDGDLLCRG